MSFNIWYEPQGWYNLYSAKVSLVFVVIFGSEPSGGRVVVAQWDHSSCLGSGWTGAKLMAVIT